MLKEMAQAYFFCSLTKLLNIVILSPVFHPQKKQTRGHPNITYLFQKERLIVWAYINLISHTFPKYLIPKVSW